MQFPESWLREFCNPSLTTEQLAEVLTMAGLEVEETQPVAPPFSLVVVGEIKTIAQHPDADRLRICQVDVGQAELLTIVCGAANARVGIKVPCAMVGAELPPGADGKPFAIKVGKLRGVPSYGMLCSATELKLPEQAQDGLLELDSDAPVGQNIRQYLNLDDVLFTLKLTPNLAHCLSVYGVAREVAALTGAPLKAPNFKNHAPSHSEQVKVKITAPDLCGRFSGRVIRNVNPKATTPAWMKDRLARCGQRGVSPLVDISNYVMFELGRPSHIFDLEKIHGDLEVRWARAGEALKLLNGNTVTLDETVGVIADAQQVESLAGIMGGDASAVSDTTRHIYLEAAFWWPNSIAGRARRFNFSTDAAHRFERGVDPATTVEHIERITQLILEICGGEVGAIDDAQINMPEAKPVTLRVARAAKILGMSVTQEQCLDALQRLGLRCEAGNGTITVIPPSYRFDLQIEEDLIEEVARIIGYQNLPTTPPLGPITPRVKQESERSPYAVRRALATLGYQETINFSFVEERWENELAGNLNPIKLLNPISSQMSVMRSSLLGSLLQVLKFNLDRKADRVQIFELGRVFLRNPDVQSSDTTVAGFDQPMRIAAAAIGSVNGMHWDQKQKNVDFFDIKGDIEALLAPQVATFHPAEHPALHPGRCARVMLGTQEIGFIGELHPRWRQSYGFAQAPVVFELALDAVLARTIPAFTSVSKLQAVERDIAIIVAERTTHQEVMHAIYGASTQGLVRNATLFDVYRPKITPGAENVALSAVSIGEKSLAVRLSLHSDVATLDEAQIEAAVQAVLQNLSMTIGARLRT